MCMFSALKLYIHESVFSLSMDGSDSKESTCNSGDSGSNPG